MWLFTKHGFYAVTVHVRCKHTSGIIGDGADNVLAAESATQAWGVDRDLVILHFSIHRRTRYTQINCAAQADNGYRRGSRSERLRTCITNRESEEFALASRKKLRYRHIGFRVFAPGFENYRFGNLYLAAHKPSCFRIAVDHETCSAISLNVAGRYDAGNLCRHFYAASQPDAAVEIPLCGERLCGKHWLRTGADVDEVVAKLV